MVVFVCAIVLKNKKYNLSTPVKVMSEGVQFYWVCQQTEGK